MKECTIRGCRNLQTTCVECGRIVSTKCLPTMEWISVNDQPVPKKGQFLVFYNDYMSVAEHLYDEDNGKSYFLNGGCVISNVSHWMPLPNPPEIKNE